MPKPQSTDQFQQQLSQQLSCRRQDLLDNSLRIAFVCNFHALGLLRQHGLQGLVRILNACICYALRAPLVPPDCSLQPRLLRMHNKTHSGRCALLCISNVPLSACKNPARHLVLTYCSTLPIRVSSLLHTRPLRDRHLSTSNYRQQQQEHAWSTRRILNKGLKNLLRGCALAVVALRLEPAPGHPVEFPVGAAPQLRVHILRASDAGSIRSASAEDEGGPG